MFKKVFKKIGQGYQKLLGWLERLLVLLSVFFFIGGIIIAKYSESFTNAIANGANAFVSGYGYVAPLAIFLILSPSLSKLFTSKTGKFGSYAFGWLALRRLLACVWAVIFTVIIFGFPLLPEGHVSVGVAFAAAMKTVGKMMITSPFMIAIWVGLVIAVVSIKVKWIYNLLDKFLAGFEALGQHFVLVVPLFMMAVGAYVYGLPSAVSEQIEIGDTTFTLSSVKFFGYAINPNTPSGMVKIYVIGALAVGAVCLLWHFLLLLLTKARVKGFSIKTYFVNYWAKVYPLLWSTSSEALATPLNLYLTKKYYPNIAATVRRFVVGMGSYLNINGTLICVFVLGGVVTSMLGLKPSMFEWMMVVPIVFILGYGVPGIPGELILFAGPIALLLSLSPEITPLFLALYIGLQIGLPDSFRTGNNSTDNAVCAILLNEVYQKKYMPVEDKARQDEIEEEELELAEVK